jgi:hypothetical protein
MRRLLAIIIIIAVYVAYEAFFNHGSWNYKLTLVVQTPEGKVVASGVRKIYAGRDPIILQWLPSLTYGHAGVIGEAVVVDLGRNGVLFALLRSRQHSVDYGYNIIFNEFPHDGGTTSGGIRYYRSLKAKKELAFDKLPLLVRFRDINAPKTVEEVDPNNLEATFGKGVKLVSATLEMTDEEVTTGVDKQLVWLKEYYNKKLDGARLTSIEAANRLANNLNSRSFKIGE